MATKSKVKALDYDLEFHPDAMERFERAVKAVAKAPPQHREKPKISKLVGA
jgi:hypothetical protein